MQAQRLGDRGLGEPGLAVGQPRLRLRVARHLRERPAQRRGGRLVPGDEQRHELIAQLAVRQRPAVFISRSQQQRQDVIPVAEVGRLPAAGDLREQLTVDFGELAPEPGEPHQPIGAEETEHQPAAGISRPRHQPPQAQGEPVESRPLLQAEDRAQHHLQGDGVHPWQRRHRHTQRPVRHLPAGRLADQLLVGEHALPVQRRQHELAPAQMLPAVEQQHVLRAQQRTQRHVRHAGVKLIRSMPVELADRVGVRENHPRLGHHAQREHVAERPVRRLKQPVGIKAEPQRLHGPRPTRTGREAPQSSLVGERHSRHLEVTGRSRNA